jgi:hypothetical protein
MWYGAHDADRTRDLVLTKDVLYQLSYVGHVVVTLHLGAVSLVAALDPLVFSFGTHKPLFALPGAGGGS